MRRLVHAVMLSALIPLAPGVQAQQAQPQWELELNSDNVLAGAQGLLERVPDGAIDGLFQAVHLAMRQPADAKAICAMFAPDADRSLDALAALAERLQPASRQRLANALADMVMMGLQGQVQAYDRRAAERALTANATRAAILHDGFSAGLHPGADGDARCRTTQAMLDVLEQRPQPERVLVTRLLFEQGLQLAMG